MSYRILLLNDSPKETELLEAACRNAGHELTSMPSIAAAMDWLNKKDHIDVIVSEVHLEDENVFDFLKAVKSDPRHDWVQFIMVCTSTSDLAATMDNQLQQAARILGADKYVMMPDFDASRLLKEIIASLPDQPPQHEQDPVRDSLGLPRPAEEIDQSMEKFGDTVAQNVRENAKKNM
jgi:CheY-like chemotaxis protein